MLDTYNDGKVVRALRTVKVLSLHITNSAGQVRWQFLIP